MRKRVEDYIRAHKHRESLQGIKPYLQFLEAFLGDYSQVI